MNPSPNTATLRSGLSVLIVDDSRHFLSGAKALFELTPRIGLVMTAASGEAALDLVSARSFDLVVLDLSMPGQNGLEIARRLNAARAAPKILMVSFYDDAEFRMAAHGAGAAEFVSKLSLAGDIEAMLERVFGPLA